MSSIADRSSDGEAKGGVNEHDDEEEPANQDGEQGRQEEADDETEMRVLELMLHTVFRSAMFSHAVSTISLLEWNFVEFG